MKFKSVIFFTLLAYVKTQTIDANASTPEMIQTSHASEVTTTNKIEPTTQSSIPPIPDTTTEMVDATNVSLHDSLLISMTNSSSLEDSQLFIMVINTFDKVPAPIRYWVITFIQTVVSAIITLCLMRIKLVRNYVLEPYFTAIRMMSNLESGRKYELTPLVR